MVNCILSHSRAKKMKRFEARTEDCAIAETLSRVQGCQVACFQTENLTLGKIGSALK
jgi:hypothetical protein